MVSSAALASSCVSPIAVTSPMTLCAEAVQPPREIALYSIFCEGDFLNRGHVRIVLAGVG